MKATQRDFAGKAQGAARQCRVFFFCGPDDAGSSMAAARIVSLFSDPGERVELSGSELRKDPVRLGDEARSISLFGDRRHILVHASGDEAHDAVKILLEGEGEACPVLILASGATDKSRTAKLLADRDDALVAMFYLPELKDAATAVRQLGAAAGVTLTADLAERIARGCGLDMRLAQSEIEKLSLYLGASPEAPRSGDVVALDAIGAQTEEDGFSPLVNVVLSGDVKKLGGELRRLKELSLNPVGLLLAFERRAAQLAQLSAKLGRGGDIQRLLDAETNARRVFFRDKRDLSEQLHRWRGRRLERLIAKLASLHASLMTNTQSAELLLAQGLAEIARVASARG